MSLIFPLFPTFLLYKAVNGGLDKWILITINKNMRNILRIPDVVFLQCLREIVYTYIHNAVKDASGRKQNMNSRWPS